MRLTSFRSHRIHVLCLARIVGLLFTGVVLLPPGVSGIESAHGTGPSEKGYRLRLQLSHRLEAPRNEAPSIGPKNGTLVLERSEGGYLGTWAPADDFREVEVRLVSSRGARFLDTLLIDTNGDRKLQKTERWVRDDPDRGWAATVALSIPDRRRPVPLPFYFLAYPSESGETLTLRYNHRAFMFGGGTIRGLGEVRVCIIDMNIDGRFRIEDDRWALAKADAAEQLFPPENFRVMTRHNWIGEVAFEAHSLSSDARQLVIVPTKPELTREEERIRDDPYHADKSERRSGGSVEFLHDFEVALDLAAKQQVPLLVDFETSWCGPCKKMDELVYTADKVVEACEGLICVKIDGDRRKDLIEKYAIKAYPTLLVVDGEGRVLGRHRGYASVARLVPWLESVRGRETGEADDSR